MVVSHSKFGGLLLGHEILFPELPRLLMLGGAELILAPLSHALAHLSPTDPLGATNLQRVCQTRSFENVAAVACVEPAGTHQNHTSRLDALGNTAATPEFGPASGVFLVSVPVGAIRQTRRGGTI